MKKDSVRPHLIFIPATQSLLKDRLLRSAKRERNLIEPGDLKEA